MSPIEELKDRFDNSAYARFFGMKLSTLEHGYARVELSLKPEFLNWGKLVHGGVISSLLDQAFGCSLNTLEYNYVAVQLSINFIKAVRAGEVYAVSRVIQAGKRLGVAELSAFDSSDNLIARATGTAVTLGARK